MILSDGSILEAMEKGYIKIDPFDVNCLGSNSYDVHLGKTLAVYVDDILDAKKENKVEYMDIPEEGFVMNPGVFYLGATKEFTETKGLVPILDGKSSVGRLGIKIHFTAGKGDVGFANHWTLEMECSHPVRIYAGMPIGQIFYHRITSNPRVSYQDKKNAKYNDVSHLPQPSRMHLNKF